MSPQSHPHPQQQRALSSEEIIAQYPEAQAVLDANQNQKYRSVSDVVHNNFSLESRKKNTVIVAIVLPIIMLATMLGMFYMEGTLDEVMLLIALGAAALAAVSAGVTAFIVNRQLDRKIEERNAALALAATQGGDVSQYMPQQFENLADQLSHPFDFSIYSSVDPRQVEANRQAAAQSFQGQPQTQPQGLEPQQGSGWKDEELFL